MLKKILIALAIVVALFFAYAATRPDTYHVERSLQIQAPADVVFAEVDNFQSWGAWSPWEKLDLQMKKTFNGPERGVGAEYAWQGNSDVGSGKMTITESNAPKHIEYRLEFIEPFAGLAISAFDLEPASSDSTKVTWSMEGQNNLVAKAMGIFMDMDSMIGGDYEKGLAALKAIAEDEAKKQRDAKAAQDAAAQAEAAAQDAAAKAQAEAAGTQ